jgi:hypothetical protein
MPSVRSIKPVPAVSILMFALTGACVDPAPEPDAASTLPRADARSVDAGVVAPAPVPVPRPVPPPRPAPPPDLAVDCAGRSGRIHVFPLAPREGERIRVVAVLEASTVGARLEVQGLSGAVLEPARRDHWGLEPAGTLLELASWPAGRYQVRLVSPAGQTVGCRDVDVAPVGERHRVAPSHGIWAVRSSWTPELEQLFSVFVARLFQADPGGWAFWRPLHQVLRDPVRNVLHDSLGWGEDDGDSRAIWAYADCADLPFSLRAYFSWKLGLPYAQNLCTRGSALAGPYCSGTHTNLTPKLDHLRDPVERYTHFAWRFVNFFVHSGNGRSLPGDDRSDLYPVPLVPGALRPGLVFVDPAGHFILATQRTRQAGSAVGALYGVDGHPDLTVTRKIFSEGTFVFERRVPTGGFKAYRPLIHELGRIRALTNAELAARGFTPASDEQSRLGSQNDFYQRIQKILNPALMDPLEMLRAKVEAMSALAQERVIAIRVADEYLRKRQGATIPMPSGRDIFQTTGPWEDYSTPARDLRFLIGLDELARFCHLAPRQPGLYRLDPREEAGHLTYRLQVELKRLLPGATFTYPRTDGSDWTLRLSDLVDRVRELEMAYNPNDCPEHRWGAPAGSKEAATCRRRAPGGQRNLMASLRPWFRNRYRP